MCIIKNLGLTSASFHINKLSKKISLITEQRKLLHLMKGCLFSTDKYSLMNVRVPDLILAEDVVLLFVSREIVETFIFPLTLAD